MKTHPILCSICCMVLLCLSVKLWAQDVHFSQYQASPLSLNPALTGNFEGNWRIANSYRSQWPNAGNGFSTNALAFDQNFAFYRANIGAGILYINDVSGIVPLLRNKLYLSAAANKKWGIHRVAVGYQIGGVHEGVNMNALSFPDQFDNETGGFNNTLLTAESNWQTNIFYLDMNVGLLWRANFGKWQPMLTYGLMHLNRPKQSFLGMPNTRLPMRHNVHASVNWKLTSQWQVAPNVMFNATTGASEIVAGANVSYFPSWNKSGIQYLFLGGHLRFNTQTHTDAAIATLGMQIKKLRVGLSHDVTLSSFQTAPGYQGAYELSLVYIGRIIPPEKLQIPCDRY